MSENEVPGSQTLAKRRQVRGSYSSTRSAFGSSSSVIEATGEEYSSEDKPASSPLSDSGYYHRHRIAALEGGRVPSASSLDDLTVKTPLHSSQQQRRPKRKDGGATLEVRSEGEEKRPRPQTSRKRSRRGEGRSSTRKRRKVASDVEKRMKVLNGAVNGQDYKVLFWDLVWAKCRGYPPYPALVIDPDMPSKGMTVNGEKIQAPSDEVLEIRKKNPAAPHLVRFFDGKRSWQWLPEDKIEPLGISSEHDTAKIAMSGSSKRSVLQAFQRAKVYQKRVESNSQTTTNEDEDDEDSDS